MMNLLAGSYMMSQFWLLQLEIRNLENTESMVILMMLYFLLKAIYLRNYIWQRALLVLKHNRGFVHYDESPSWQLHDVSVLALIAIANWL